MRFLYLATVNKKYFGSTKAIDKKKKNSTDLSQAQKEEFK